MQAETTREGFKSRLGFLLVCAGCAIGVGNVWRFPYIVGQNGGGLFVLFYLIFLTIMGVPILCMELAIGRASRKTVFQGIKALEKPGQKWHLQGWVSYFGSLLLMMYYTTVSGWMLAYFWKFLIGEFEDKTSGELSGMFGSMLENPSEMFVFTGLIIALGFFVLCFGVQKGLERVSKVMMLALLGLIIVLAVHSLTLKGAGEGLKFYLVPNADNIVNVGFSKVILSAMSQAFFTLSLGIGAMEIFGSYMEKDHTLLGESVKICSLDTFVALMAGLVIFPACASYDVEIEQGPALIFEALPKLFINMPGGRIWGALFFLFMVFASFSTVTAVFENLVRNTMDSLGWSRIKSIASHVVIVTITSIPCILGFNLWKDLKFPGDQDVLGFEDFLVSNILLPGGCLIFILFCSWKFGWGADKFLEETNTGKGMKLHRAFIPYFKYVLPILILIVMISGFIS